MTSPQLEDLSLNYRCSRFFPLRNIQTCSGSYPVFYPVINFNPSPSFKAAGAWSWKITVHPTPSLRMSGVTVYISYIPYYGHVKPLPLPQFFSIIIPTQISWSGLKFTWIEDASLGQDFRHFHRIYSHIPVPWRTAIIFALPAGCVMLFYILDAQLFLQP